MNPKILPLFEKLRLRYSSLPYDEQRVFWKIVRSLNIIYPYHFIFDSKGKPNYNLKSIVFNDYVSDLKVVRLYMRGIRIQDMLSRYTWAKGSDGVYGLNEDGSIFKIINLKEFTLYNEWIRQGELLKDKSRFLFNECERIVLAEYQRRKRLRKRIQNIFDSGNTYFLTLTFNDFTLNNTSAETRRKYVTRLMKSLSSNYVGNIDFGKLNGREHYHVVFYSDKLNDAHYDYDKRYGYICKFHPDIDIWAQYGFYALKQVCKDDKDKNKMASYVAKLVNHAVKETTKRNAMIYSR